MAGVGKAIVLGAARGTRLIDDPQPLQWNLFLMTPHLVQNPRESMGDRDDGLAIAAAIAAGAGVIRSDPAHTPATQTGCAASRHPAQTRRAEPPAKNLRRGFRQEMPLASVEKSRRR